ncbi:hypothetical protein YC2023_083707 [Brassica napus]
MTDCFSCYSVENLKKDIEKQKKADAKVCDMNVPKMVAARSTDKPLEEEQGELPSVTQNLESNSKQYPNLGQRQK